MNKYDWISVGMCLYGIHLVATALLQLVSIVTTLVAMGSAFAGLSTFAQMGLFPMLLQSFVGSCLVLLGPNFTAVLERREKRMRELGQVPAAPAPASPSA